jgi:phospholipase C
MSMKRRDAIKTIGGLAGAATLSRMLPACGGNDGPNGITTYVFMMMENRSYDHLLGAWNALEGHPGDGHAGSSVTELDVNNQPVTAWEPNKDQLCDLDPPHDWDHAHFAFNSGACDQFLKAHQMDHQSATATEVMQYLTRTEVPVSYALADAYTVCDRWFCSVMGPTWPNRFYWHTGSSGGLMTNELPADGYLTWPSLYNRLQEKNVDWAYYYGSIPVLSALNNPGPYQLETDYIATRVRTFANFFTDAMAGKLPPVVYIDPAFYQNDDHPPIHPINGQELIASVYTALAMSPQWKNCMLVVTYDENGGFKDHVAPPKTMDDYAATGFDQMGFRVPTIVAGPYVKESYISSVVYDHTSPLRHVQNTFGLDPLSMRSQAANDLTDVIDMDRLAKNQWNPPVEIPDVNIADWPMAANCFGTGREVDPISKWADQYPAKVAAFGPGDQRPQIAAYRKTIRDFLAWARGR